MAGVVALWGIGGRDRVEVGVCWGGGLEHPGTCWAAACGWLDSWRNPLLIR